MKPGRFYDAIGQQTHVMDAAGVAAFDGDYEDAKKVNKFSLPNTIIYTYDANGNLIITRDAEGNAIWMFYDALGRQTHVTDSLGVEEAIPEGQGDCLLSTTLAFDFKSDNIASSGTHFIGFDTDLVLNECTFLTG